MPALHKLRSRTGLWASAGMVTAGLGAGAILGTTVTAGASTSTSTNTAASTSSASGASSSSANANSPAYGGPGGAMPAGPRAGLPDSGTVTAVGSSSVTIDGKAYAVTSNSDIDKNGEASLSALAVGDKVTYSTVSGAATPTIDKLHAGNESLDRPSGPPPGQAGGNGSPTSGATSSGAGSSASSAA